MVKLSDKESLKESLKNPIALAFMSTVFMNPAYVMLSTIFLGQFYKMVCVSMAVTLFTVLLMFIKKKLGIYVDKEEKWFYYTYIMQLVITYVVVFLVLLLQG